MIGEAALTAQGALAAELNRADTIHMENRA